MAAKLVVTTALETTEVQLELGTEYFIGRSHEANVLVRDPQVSRRHCQIAAGPDRQWTLTDLGSGNGTFLGKTRLTRHLFRHGDIVRVGRSTVEFRQGESERPAPAPAAQPRMASPAEARPVARAPEPPSEDIPVLSPVESTPAPPAASPLPVARAVVPQAASPLPVARPVLPQAGPLPEAQGRAPSAVVPVARPVGPSPNAPAPKPAGAASALPQIARPWGVQTPGPAPAAPVPAPAGQPASAAEAGQWCVAADELSPGAVGQAAARGRGRCLSARLECSPGRVGICQRTLTRPEILGIISRYPLWMAWNGFVIVWSFFRPFMALLAYVMSFFTDIGLLIALPFIVIESVREFFVSAYWFFWMTVQLLKGLFALISGRPYTFVPLGVRLQHEVLAEFTRGAPVQVLRLDLPLSYVKSAQKAGPGPLGCLVTLTFFPVVVFARIAQRFTRVCQFAFVVGKPVDLAAPSGSMARLFRRGKAREGEERTVFLLTVSPALADRVQDDVQMALGASVVRVDEKLASETLWR